MRHVTTRVHREACTQGYTTMVHREAYTPLGGSRSIFTDINPHWKALGASLLTLTLTGRLSGASFNVNSLSGRLSGASL